MCGGAAVGGREKTKMLLGCFGRGLGVRLCCGRALEGSKKNEEAPGGPAGRGLEGQKKNEEAPGGAAAGCLELLRVLTELRKHVGVPCVSAKSLPSFFVTRLA